MNWSAVHQVIEPDKLKKFFPEVELEEFERPEVNFVNLENECQVIEEDSYVDDLLTSHNDLNKLKLQKELKRS